MRVQLISNFHNRFREVVREQFNKIGKRIHSWKLHLFLSSKKVVSNIVHFFRSTSRRYILFVLQPYCSCFSATLLQFKSLTSPTTCAYNKTFIPHHRNMSFFPGRSRIIVSHHRLTDELFPAAAIFCSPYACFFSTGQLCNVMTF